MRQTMVRFSGLRSFMSAVVAISLAFGGGTTAAFSFEPPKNHGLERSSNLGAARSSEPQPGEGLDPTVEMEIESALLKIKDFVEGAVSENGKPVPGTSELTEVAFHLHDLACGAAMTLLHSAANKLSLKRVDDPDVATALAAKIDELNHIIAKLAEACAEHKTTKPEPGPSGPGNPPVAPPKGDPKSEADYRNIERKCDPDGRIREMIAWNERRLLDLYDRHSTDQSLYETRRSELAQLRGQLCPCLDRMKSTADLAGDKDLLELVKGMIGNYCKTPAALLPPTPQPPSDGSGSMGKSPSAPLPPAKSPSKLGEGTEFKSIQPAPGDGTGKEEGAYLPPIAGPGSTIFATVVDPNEEGPHDFVVGTVDDTGKHNYFKGVTDVAGHLAFVVPAGVTAVELFRHFDKNGNPDPGAQTNVGPVPHVTDTTPLPPEKIPSGGPAIVEGNPVIQRGGPANGTFALHTRGTDPSTTKVLIDDKPVTTYAASDLSVVARVSDNLTLGTHQLSVASGGIKSNAFPADVVAVRSEPLPPIHVGAVTTLHIHVEGIPSAHIAMMHFDVSGAAQVRGGGGSADVPVKNGMASLQIQGVHAGQLVARYRLRVAIPGFWQMSGQ